MPTHIARTSKTPGTSGTSIAATADRSARSPVLVLTVAFTLLGRFVLAGRESYWLDELYSVYAYTVQPDGFLDAMRALADTSIHPPLYQSILYGWVALVGDTEVATRTLSSLFVAAATIALHRLARRQFDLRTADVVAVMFAVSSAATLYGLETRSYAQTLLLTTASMLALDHLLRPSQRRTTAAVPALPAIALGIANVALLMTHYYNLFLWGAQALLVAAVVLRQEPLRTAWRRLAWVAGLYVAQLGVFVLLWGPTLWASYRADSGNYDTPAPTVSPFDIAGLVVDEEFSLGAAAVPALLIASVVAIVLGGRGVVRGGRGGSGRGLGLLQAGWMSVGPAIVAYLAFLVVGAERVLPRYFVYLAPPLLILGARVGIRTIEGFLVLAQRKVSWLGARMRSAASSRAALPLLLALLLTVPGGYVAAVTPKADWRGTAQQIAAIVDTNPDRRVTVWETSFRATPMLDYHLARHGDLRVDGVIRRFENDRGEGFAFEEALDQIREHDWLVVPFIHHTTQNMAVAVDALDATFTRKLSIIDDDGRGLLIYDTGRGA